VAYLAIALFGLFTGIHPFAHEQPAFQFVNTQQNALPFPALFAVRRAARRAGTRSR
jgi:hypothetical protein